MVRRDVSAAVLPASNRFPPKYAVLLTQDESFRAQKTSSNHAFVEPRNRLSLDLKNGRKSPCIQYLIDADFALGAPRLSWQKWSYQRLVLRR
jgi:hypothetical protein